MVFLGNRIDIRASQFTLSLLLLGVSVSWIYTHLFVAKRDGSKYKMWLRAARWEPASKVAIWASLHRGNVDPWDESCSYSRIETLTTLS